MANDVAERARAGRRRKRRRTQQKRPKVIYYETLRYMQVFVTPHTDSEEHHYMQKKIPSYVYSEGRQKERSTIPYGVYSEEHPNVHVQAAQRGIDDSFLARLL